MDFLCKSHCTTSKEDNMVQEDRTPLSIWEEDARDTLKPIWQGADITDGYRGKEAKVMRGILEAVDLMVVQLSRIPKPCKCDSEDCPAWDKGYGAAEREAKDESGG